MTKIKDRIIRSGSDVQLLLANGDIVVSDSDDVSYHAAELLLFMSRYEEVNYIPDIPLSTVGKWCFACPDIASFPGETIAYKDSNNEVIVCDKAMLIHCLEQYVYGIEYLPTRKYAELHNKSHVTIKVLCREGRFPRAKKIGRDWLLPASTPYPENLRLKKTRQNQEDQDEK